MADADFCKLGRMRTFQLEMVLAYSVKAINTNITITTNVWWDCFAREYFSISSTVDRDCYVQDKWKVSEQSKMHSVLLLFCSIYTLVTKLVASFSLTSVAELW